jgi:hypothetical protein
VARLRGLGSFLLIAGAALLLLRGVHLGVPLFFPETQPGPFVLGSLDEVRRRAGFAPLVPAYRPESLGERPASITVSLSPHPTFVIVWRGEHYLRLTQWRGGAEPAYPPASQPLPGAPASAWWEEGSRRHLVLRHGELWVTVETDLPSRDLGRIADTLRPY